MEDQFREIEALDDIAVRILGHAREGQRGTYVEGPPLRAKAKWIAKVSDSSLSTLKP